VTSMTKRDAIESAMSVADDVAQGRLAPIDLERQAVAECRELFGTVAGEGDVLWDLHLDIARQVLALDGVPADELSEWLAVARQRAGESLSQAEPDQPPPVPESPHSAALILEAAEPVAEPEPEAVVPVNDPPRPRPAADGYDPLAHWQPGKTRRN
jgi:hypothetical protein